MKIDESLVDSGLLIKGIIKSFKNESKEQKDRFPSLFLLGTLGVIFLGSLLADKELRVSELTMKLSKTVIEQLGRNRIFNAISFFD